MIGRSWLNGSELTIDKAETTSCVESKPTQQKWWLLA